MSSYAKAQMGSVGVCVGLFIYTLGTKSFWHKYKYNTDCTIFKEDY